MIEQSRSFENRGYATRRDHLLPVIRERFAASPEPWWHSLLLWVAIFGTAFAGLVFG